MLHPERLIAVAMLGTVTLVLPAAFARQEQLANPRPAVESGNSSGDLSALPAEPAGKTTILGGAIKDLDPVRDQFSLHIYGQRPMKILFDERTRIYRDGVRIPLRELAAVDHASVQTVLDGANVFAVSIHILAQSAEGVCQGRVQSFDPATGELAVSSDMSPEPVRLIVGAEAPIVREGEAAFTSVPSRRNDLVAGALISVSFRPDQNGRDIASHVAVLAVPGASFQFDGKISYLDSRTQVLDLVDSQDGKSYRVHLDSLHSPLSQNIHLGDNVTVKASYDGSRYEASEITVN